jgi:4-amino-4-deoxy-L-arabinose transferase-like glycosyltransferase
LLWAALTLALCVGILGRGYWTPDEPREADLAWRMSWQPSKAVPLLAGEAFCEKPPFAYWVAGAAIGAWGSDAWVARLPNVLYALVTALAVGMIGRRSAGPAAGLAAAAAMSTLLLSYQAAIWLATDAPLLAAVAVALLGLYLGFYAKGTGERLRGYCLMHLALAVGFLSKSAAAWMVPVLALATLVIWERRWRELLRWELYAGLCLQAALVLAWVWVVYTGPDGALRLKVFFWNNLAGRFAHVDAPEELQYAAAHRNSPGKYLIELPVYLWPWTLLVAAAVRRAWQQRSAPPQRRQAVRFALATFVPALGVLSVAATARNIYLAPAFPGVALLLGWWVNDLATTRDRWDVRALRGTCVLLLLSVIVLAAAVILLGVDSWDVLNARFLFAAVSALGLAGALAGALVSWQAVGRGRLLRACFGLLLAYCALLIGPCSQIYRRVDAWQDLGSIGRAIGRDAGGRPMILFAPDETTRAFIDMYTRTTVGLIPGPVTAQSAERLRDRLVSDPQTLVVAQLPGRNVSRTFREWAGRLGLGERFGSVPMADDAELPAWATQLQLRIARRYALPNGRRYVLLGREPATASR